MRRSPQKVSFAAIGRMPRVIRAFALGRGPDSADVYRRRRPRAGGTRAGSYSAGEIRLPRNNLQ